MDFTISINDNPKAIALQRALDVYNASNQPLTPEGFMQKLIDGQLANLVASYVVTILTKRAFLERFTPAERVAIRTAAQSSVAIQDYLELVNVSDNIDLTYSTTIAGVQELETAGLIAAGRAAEILSL
ncbi:MAG: hypothetical protein ACXWIU_10455 [Limisphaerales bacterium]